MRHQAIIIKKQPLRESDELVMCYTREQGKQRYIAKSSVLASSKQGGHLDVLNHIEFNTIQGKHFDIIASAHAINTFSVVKSSLPALAKAFFILECFDKLVYENERDEKLWEFLSGGSFDRAELIAILGYHHSAQLNDLTPAHFTSLQFLDTLR